MQLAKPMRPFFFGLLAAILFCFAAGATAAERPRSFLQKYTPAQ
jgi:hypothetical protein